MKPQSWKVNNNNNSSAISISFWQTRVEVVRIKLEISEHFLTRKDDNSVYRGNGISVTKS